MRHRLPAVLVAAVLLIAIATPVQARDPQQTRHEQIVAYWTAERLASAVPRDFVYEPGRGFVQRAKPDNPGKPGGGGGGDGSTTGSSWTGGGLVKEATGKVYFEMGGNAYVCSGTVATDFVEGRSLVLTAAHCAYDETNRAFATRWLFIPDFDESPTFTCADTQYGCWTASALVVHEGYATAGGFNTQATLHDFAFAVVGGGGHSETAQLETAVGGSFPLSVGGFDAPGDNSHAFGYPAAQKYKGDDLVYCAGSIFEDPYNSELTWGLPCKMTGGSSGGPWISNFTAGDAGLSSLNSYGYSGVSAMHGPKFNGDTVDVFNAARSATSNRIVADGS